MPGKRAELHSLSSQEPAQCVGMKGRREKRPVRIIQNWKQVVGPVASQTPPTRSRLCAIDVIQSMIHRQEKTKPINRLERFKPGLARLKRAKNLDLRPAQHLVTIATNMKKFFQIVLR